MDSFFFLLESFKREGMLAFLHRQCLKTRVGILFSRFTQRRTLHHYHHHYHYPEKLLG